MQKITGQQINIDIPTLISISIIAYIIQNILHEFIGHGGAAMLVGGKIISLSTAYLEHDLNSVNESGRRIVAAAGSIVNILAGLLCWILLKGQKNKTSAWTFFIWLSMTVNLLTGTGYFLFSGVAGIGDWNVVIEGVEGYWLWRIILTLSGIILYLLTILLALHELTFFIGDEKNT